MLQDMGNEELDLAGCSIGHVIRVYTEQGVAFELYPTDLTMVKDNPVYMTGVAIHLQTWVYEAPEEEVQELDYYPEIEVSQCIVPASRHTSLVRRLRVGQQFLFTGVGYELLKPFLGQKITRVVIVNMNS